jgi:pimeloyl-ACP methyl ester carboxylesterase
MQICYIHGFNQSPHSFNYLRLLLPTHDAVALSYKSHQPLRDSMQEVRDRLPKGEFALVGHSLGGVLAVLMTAEHADRVTKVVTISSPLGGSKAASSLRWIPGHPKIVEDITPSSPKIELISQLKLSVPTLSLVSTAGGLTLSPEPNDGIVTVDSQRALKFGRKVEIKANHFEILMFERTAKLIEGFLFEDAE